MDKGRLISLAPLVQTRIRMVRELVNFRYVSHSPKLKYPENALD